MSFLSRLRGRRTRSSSNRRHRPTLFESLEERRVLAPITGGTGPGGFILTGAASDMVLWTRADSLALNNGDAVATWADQSGRGNDLGTPTGPITYMTSAANGLPTVQFGNPAANTNGWLQRPGLLANGQSGEVFFMVQSPDANNGVANGGFYRTGTSSNQHYSWSDNFAYENFGTNTRVDAINVLGAAGGTYNPVNHNIYNVSGVNAGAWAIRLNGEVRASKTSNGASTFHAQWYFGRSESGNEWQGQISEIVMHNRALNAAERVITQNYLHSKYGVVGALTDDRYAGDTPANGNFDREVFGVGRFDATNQVLSAGQAGFGIEAAALGNGDYVLAGHNVAANGTTTAGITGTGVAQRWTRSWLIDVTDSDDSVGATLAFDYSDAGLPIGLASTFKLLRSTDGGATFVDVGAASSVAGDLVTFNLSAAELSTGIYTLGDSAGPVLTPSAGTVSHTVGGAATTIDAGLIVVPGGATMAQSATISITGFVNGDSDVLDAVNSGGLSESYNATTGVLTLTGTDTVANYQTYLRSVTYAKPSFQNTATRDVVFQVTDTAALSGSATRTVLVNASAAADTIVWDGDSDADGDGVTWSDPLNWSADRVPDANDIANFGDLDVGAVTVTAPATVGRLLFTTTTGAGFALGASGGGLLTLTDGTAAIQSTASVASTITAPLVFTASPSIDISASANLTISGTISGTVGLTKAGSGTLILSATANTYTGATTINAGTLRALGASPALPINLSNTSGGLNIADTTHIKASSFYSPDNRAPQHVSNWSGQTGTFPTGTAGNIPANTMWLSDGFTGAGTWIAWDLGAVYTIDKLHVWNYNEVVGGQNYPGRGVKQFDLQIASSAPAEFLGGGTWTNAQTVTNFTVANGLTTEAGFDFVLAAPITTRYIRFNNTLNFQTADNYTGLSEVVFYQQGSAPRNPIPDGSPVIVASGAVLDLAGSSETIGSLAGAGSVTSSAGGTSTLTIGGDNTSTAFSGVISNGAGNISLTKIGGGTQTLSSANTYTGPTTINGGTLQLASGADRLPVGTQLTLGVSGILDLNNQSQTVASLSGSGRVVDSTNDGTFPVLTVNVAGASTFSGVLGNTNQNGFDLVKSGTGTLALTGANTFTGKTSINAGTLSVNADAAFGTAPGAAVANQITIANNATLTATASFTLNANRGITLGAGGGTISLTGVGLTYAGVIAGNTVLNKVGAGDLILTGGGLNTPGTININAGRLFFNSQNALGTGPVNINNGGTLDYQSGGALTITNAINIASGGNIASRGTSLTTSATLPTTGTLIINQDDQNTGTVILTSNIALSGALTIQVGGGGGNGGVGRIDGLISGSQTITKTQNGVLHLNNAGNSFSGDLNISAGTVRVSQNGALGTTTGVTIVASGATLNFDGAFNYTTPEPTRIIGTGVGGAGAISKTTGSGSISTPILLTGSATIGSNTAGSALTITDDINLSTGNLTLSGVGQIVVNGNLTPGAASNSVIKTGTGTATLSGNNTYTGATTINAGTLIAGSGNAFGTTDAGTIVNSGGTLGLTNASLPAGESLTLSGNGAAGQLGALVNLFGNNVVAGPITVSAIGARIGSAAGTLTINGDVNLTNGKLTVDGDGALVITGDITSNAPAQGARFIQIEKQTAGATESEATLLHVGELEVFAIGVPAGPTGHVAGNNVALNNANDQALASKGATVFSASALGGHGLAAEVIDGQEEQGATTWTKWAGAGLLAQITINMGQDVSVGTVRVHQRNDACCQGRLQNFKVKVFENNSGSPGALLAEQLFAGTAPTDSFAEFTFNVPMGTAGLIKQGNGTLTLSGTNSYRGETTVLAGTLVAADGTALGLTAEGTTVATGATLALQKDLFNNPINVAEPITAVGTGVSGSGAIRNLAGNNIISGVVTTSASTFGAPISTPLQMASAFASQPSWPATTLIDNVLTGANGWADDTSGVTNANTVVFETQTDLGPVNTASELTFTLSQTSNVNLHNLGRFRLSYTTDARGDFADGLINGGDVTANWTVLTPTSAVSTLGASGATLTILADGSILASGTNPNTDTYVVKAQTLATQITGFRLEVMLDASLPTSGPGRASNGNFVLSEFRVQAASALLSGTLGIASDTDTLTIANTINSALNATTLAFSGAGNILVSSAIDQPSGTVDLVKSGAGTLTLSAGNTYANGTTINGGTLLANNTSGSATGPGSVTVSGGATLGGTGSIAGAASLLTGATIAPGPTTADLAVGNLTLNVASVFNAEINGPVANTQYDQVIVTGDINLGGATLNLIPTFLPAVGQYIVLIDNQGPNPVGSTFNGLLDEGTFNLTVGATTRQYKIDYNFNAATNTPNTGNDVAIFLANAAPTVAASSATTSVNEGSAATMTGTYNDPNAGDNVVLTASVGTVTKLTGVDSGTWTWAGPVTTDGLAGPFSVTITATDPNGATGTTAFTYTVNNVPPTLTLSGAATVNEGALYTLNLAKSDPGTDTITGWTINWGDGSAPQTVGNVTSVTHTFADGTIVRTISATATDEDGTYNSNNFNVTVNDVAPTLVISGLASVNEGAAYTLNLSVTDPGADPIAQWIITWGDGNVETVPGNPASWTHIYRDGPLNAAISATVVNGDTQTAVSNALSVQVVNVAPVPKIDDVQVGGNSLSTIPATIGSVPGVPVMFVFSATDVAPDPLDAPFTFTINWGNGTFSESKSTPGLVAQNVPVAFTYDFAGQAFGTYQPTISVVDNDGSPAGTIVLPKIQLAQAVTVDGVLYVGGSDGADRIVIKSGGSAGAMVQINGAKGQSFSVSSKIIVFGNGGNDTISSTLSIPIEMYGGAGNDYLAGGGAADLLDGGDDSDRILGGGGDDVLLGGGGADTLTGGAGHDWLEGDAYSDFEAERDVFTGLFPRLLPDESLQGNDTLNSDAGNDTANGQGGNDRVYGGAGNDVSRGGDGQDTVDGGVGNDLLIGDGGGDLLYGRAGVDVLIGGGGSDQLYGYTGADLLFGGDLADPDDLDSLNAMAALWFANDKQGAADALESLAQDDDLGDILHGEADSDWYLMYMFDALKMASESKTPNKLITLP